MEAQHFDRTCALILPGNHVRVEKGHFAGQEGVVVSVGDGIMTSEHASKHGGPIIVYMRNAPLKLLAGQELFEIVHSQATYEEARLGLPAPEDCLRNILTVAFEGDELFILSTAAPTELIGIPQGRRGGGRVIEAQTVGETVDRQLAFAISGFGGG